MIGFPFDSHVTYDEEGSPIYDRAISSAPYRKLLRELFSTGIMPTNSENMQVAAGEGMSVIVRPGFAVVEGCLKLEEETRTLALQAADSTLDRIDTVVLRLDSNDSARVCDFYIVQGVPSLVPIHPELTRNESVYEIGLADVLVTKQASVVSDSKITDTRFDVERCGVVSSVSEFDTSTLDQQIRAWSQEQQEEFSAWVESIKSILDESTAGHLQNQIDELRESAGGVKDLIGGEYEAGKTYKRGEIAVSDGKVWKSKINNNAGNTPAAGSYWEETTIAKESGNLGGLVFGYDGDGNGGYYKADGSFAPFNRVDDLLPLFGDCVFYSDTIGDTVGFYNKSRWSKRTSNEPALLGYCCTKSGASNVAIFAKSSAGRSNQNNGAYGNWLSNTGTFTTPKGHTVYYGYANGASGDVDFYSIIKGVTTNVGVSKLKCPLVLDNQANTIVLWLADKLLFGE